MSLNVHGYGDDLTINGIRIGGSYTYTLDMDAYSSGAYIVNMYVDSKLIDSQKILYIK